MNHETDSLDLDPIHMDLVRGMQRLVGHDQEMSIAVEGKGEEGDASHWREEGRLNLSQAE